MSCSQRYHALIMRHVQGVFYTPSYFGNPLISHRLTIMLPAGRGIAVSHVQGESIKIPPAVF